MEVQGPTLDNTSVVPISQVYMDTMLVYLTAGSSKAP
jgi:hypothetical protein